MYNKNNFAIHKIASDSTIKQELHAVAFYGNRSVATDAFRLIEMTAWGEPHEPILYDRDEVKKIKLEKGVIKSELRDATTARPYEGLTYPDVDIVTKKAFREAEDPTLYTMVMVNAELLEGLLTIMKKLNTFGKVSISVPKERNKAMVLFAETVAQGTADKQTARALLMPIVK